jgi:hypothetical protein
MSLSNVRCESPKRRAQDRLATGRRVSIRAASNRAASAAKAGVGPFQRNWSMSSKIAMSVRSVASVRKSSARSRSREREFSRALKLAGFTRHSQLSNGMDSRWTNLARTAADDLAPQPRKPDNRLTHRPPAPDNRESIPASLPSFFKDLAQCARGTRMVQLNRRTKVILDEAGVAKKFGISRPLRIAGGGLTVTEPRLAPTAYPFPYPRMEFCFSYTSKYFMNKITRMTSKERVLCAIQHKPMDRVPVNYLGTPEVDAKLRRYRCRPAGWPVARDLSAGRTGGGTPRGPQHPAGRGNAAGWFVAFPERGISNLLQATGLSLGEAVSAATSNPAVAARMPGRQSGLVQNERADLVRFALRGGASV